MKLFLASYLHLECHEAPPEIEVPSCDVIVLAGDISSMKEALSYCSEVARCHATPVIFVPGNHEYYRGNYVELSTYARSYADSNVHVLLENMVVIGGVRFIGTTLWTDFTAGTNGHEGRIHRNQLNAAKYINDFRVISMSDKKSDRLRPGYVMGFYHESCYYLREQLAKPFDGKTVVITHFCPSIRLEDPKFKGSELSSYFNANCDSIIKEYQPDFWLFGHTHHCVDTCIDKTRIISNQFGYRREWGYTGYRPQLLIDVE